MKFIKLRAQSKSKVSTIFLNIESICFVKGNEEFTIVVCNNGETIDVLDSIEYIEKFLYEY